MTKRPTSIRLTPATEKQLEWLAERGYGNTTTIITTAIDRMYDMEMRRLEYIEQHTKKDE